MILQVSTTQSSVFALSPCLLSVVAAWCASACPVQLTLASSSFACLTPEGPSGIQ